jgi:hypothetical protein
MCVRVAGMGLNGWHNPFDGVLKQAPQAASIACLFGICEQDKLELLCDMFFQIERDFTPELALGGHLRPFVHCWLGAQLRFFPQRLVRLGNEHKIIDRLRRCVVRAELADTRPGAVDTWLRDHGAIVVAHFNERNIRIAQPFGGVGGFEPLVASIANLSNVVFTQGVFLLKLIFFFCVP